MQAYTYTDTHDEISKNSKSIMLSFSTFGLFLNFAFWGMILGILFLPWYKKSLNKYSRLNILIWGLN